MSIAIWLLAGVIVGWLAYSVLGFNQARGKIASIAIGAMGGVVGGSIVAPIFTAAAVSGTFSLSGLFYATVIAAAMLALGDLLYARWGV